jgi:hypothetical protein
MQLVGALDAWGGADAQPASARADHHRQLRVLRFEHHLVDVGVAAGMVEQVAADLALGPVCRSPELISSVARVA